jgi:TetR/AcrR family transcriptional regulator
MHHKPLDISDTKRKIFEAALDCFARKGYDGTTMDDVISTAGVSKGSIYWHFKSKKELFVELVHFWWEGLMERYVELMRGKGSAMERITNMIHMTIESCAHDIYLIRAFMEFFNIGLKDPEFMRYLMWLYEEGFKMTSEVIEQGIADGEFGIADARFHAEAINMYFDGLMMHLLLDPDYFNEEIIDKSVNFIKRALLYKNQKES